MSYAIVYSSQTGNTAQLATHIKHILPAKELVYFGSVSPDALHADIFLFLFLHCSMTYFVPLDCPSQNGITSSA